MLNLSIECHERCKTCSGSTIYNCTSCEPGKKIDGGQCSNLYIFIYSYIILVNVPTTSPSTTSCQEGEYKSGGICKSKYIYLNIYIYIYIECASTCKTCFGHAHRHCSSCKPGKYLKGSRCSSN